MTIFMPKRIVAAPPPGGSDPGAILGANAISWFDVATATMHQEAARTNAVANGDPVGSVQDEVSGFWVSEDSTGRGTYNVSGGRHSIQFRTDHLTKALSRTGTMYCAMAVSFQEDLASDVRYAFALRQNTDSWWQGAHLYLQNNGWLTPDTLFVGHSASGGNEASPGAAEGLATPFVVEWYVDGTTIGTSKNGAADATATGSAGPPATAFMDLGVAKSGGAFTSDPTDCDLYGLAVANAMPDSTQRADLRAWAAGLCGVTL